MLQNAYCLAKIGADTAKNERNFAEILPKTDYPTDPTNTIAIGLAPLRQRRREPLLELLRAAGARVPKDLGWK